MLLFLLVLIKIIQYPDPLSNELANLYHPQNDLWTDHFQWNEDSMLTHPT